ncbi:hypothetical protein SERLA73DRAFT_74447 [Serpula lacrymans var. lacrymans S7.3]|uniref:Uncharacterized protein n=1 Tax=Serpula lacrymans var. lacrymans (strain S7.3) TaxID=936435 RepID=F8Q1N7_SERL3|nr:hypothetical protein SERLA73DRAFT_74447 [Serpula lacrymans var. lacrymans S7.3]
MRVATGAFHLRPSSSAFGLAALALSFVDLGRQKSNQMDENQTRGLLCEAFSSLSYFEIQIRLNRYRHVSPRYLRIYHSLKGQTYAYVVLPCDSEEDRGVERLLSPFWFHPYFTRLRSSFHTVTILRPSFDIFVNHVFLEDPSRGREPSRSRSPPSYSLAMRHGVIQAWTAPSDTHLSPYQIASLRRTFSITLRRECPNDHHPVMISRRPPTNPALRSSLRDGGVPFLRNYFKIRVRGTTNAPRQIRTSWSTPSRTIGSSRSLRQNEGDTANARFCDSIFSIFSVASGAGNPQGWFADRASQDCTSAHKIRD